MPNAFAEICFTPSVKAAQSLYGSRQANRGFELSDDSRNSLGRREAEFIAERDSFYQATVSESGWPYVQHRGGPKGFLKVLDERTLGYADFRGNIQYLSVGNLNANDRISLILMDYPNRKRLKIWGRAGIVHEADDQDLIARLEVATYRARIERGIIIHVEAYDWNCPQHITPRYSEDEMERVLEPLLEENRRLKALASAAPKAEITSLGDGPLELTITGIRQLTKRVRAYELSSPNGAELPGFEAGAHLTVPVKLSNGEAGTRHYSICSDPADTRFYEIAVLREEHGRGGSIAVHEQFALGLRLKCGLPRNHFKLHADCRPAILVAGGIGITPIKAMAHHLRAQARDFQIHYAVPSETDAAYLQALKQAFGGRLTVYAADRYRRLNPAELLSASPPDAVFYVCGPGRLIDAFTTAARLQGKGEDSVRLERFSPLTGSRNQPIEVELIRSKQRIEVAAGQSILDAVRDAGVDAPYGCRVGNCGSCAVKVLEGVADHRDCVLSRAEKECAGLICICVSRARSARLVLDL